MPYTVSSRARRYAPRRPWTRRARMGGSQIPGQGRYLRRLQASTRAAVPRGLGTVALAPKQGFPQRITLNLPYQKRYRDNPGVVTLTDNVFNLSSMNDIDVSGGGAVGQARGWDQWATAYDYYRVNWVKVILSVRQRAAHGLAVYLVPNATTSTIADSRPYEMQMSQNLGITSTNQPPIEVSRTFFPHRILGMSATEYQVSDNTAGAVGAAPSQMAYLHLLCQNIDNATVLDDEFDIKFLFNVTLFDRADVAIS